MIRQAGGHRRRTGLPPALPIVDLNAQGLQRASQVVYPILPSARSLQHLPFFGKGQALTHQPSVHLPAGQMRPLNIDRMLTKQRPHLFRVAVDHFDPDTPLPVSCPTLDHLEVMPVGLGLLAPRRSPPGLNHRFPVAPLPISGYRRRLDAPFFSLVTNISPKGIQLGTGELVIGKEQSFNLFNVLGCLPQPGRIGEWQPGCLSLPTRLDIPGWSPGSDGDRRIRSPLFRQTSCHTSYTDTVACPSWCDRT